MLSLEDWNMNTLAAELNKIIGQCNPQILEMLAHVGKSLFFPKGILSQSAEAKEKAHRINATIGIAKESGHTMCFDTVMSFIKDVPASQSLTYAPSFGIPNLRKRWQKELRVKNPSLGDKPISLPVVTCGVTHGVSVFADLWIDPGDVVILPQLMWGNYNMILGVRKGARMSHYTLFNDQNGFNLDEFENVVRKEASTNKKIVVLLNFPQNPTGYAISKDEAESIVNILTRVAQEGTQVIAALDDAYFGLFYEEQTLKESLFALLSGRHPNLLAVKLDGGTKEHFIWGLRIGFITYGAACDGDVAPLYEALEKKTAGAIRGNISNASHLSQTLLLNSMQSPANQAEREEKFNILKRRALAVKAVLADPKFNGAWEPYPFNSGYFMCLRLRTVEAEPLRLHLLNRYGVGLISLGKYDLRVAFSCIDESQVVALFDTILQGVKDLESA
jgi:aspartate/methionine/tyrosine aminotransferase